MILQKSAKNKPEVQLTSQRSCGNTVAAAVAQAAPVVVSLEAGEGVSLRRGPESLNLGHIEGWGSDQVGAASTPVYPGLSVEGPRRVARWWVQGAGEVTIRWAGGRAGAGSVTISV